MRVVVVGAGFAGLAAADALLRGGAEVVVLEARDRVGGRVWSRELANGAVVEMGAEFVLPGNSAVLAMVERFGLGVWSKGMSYGDREPRGGIGVDRSTLLAALATVEGALEEQGARAAAVSARGFLDGLGLDAGALEAIVARLEVSSANIADRVDASHLAGLAAHTTERCPSVAGGNQRIATSLAATLGDAVHTSSPVERIAWTDTSVRAAAAGGEVEADACVVTVPATVFDRIAFEPPLPDAVTGGLSRSVYGHAAKLFVPLRAPAAPSAVLSVPERYWTWTATGASDVVQPIVSCFAGSAPALERLHVGAGPDPWVASVERLRPDLRLDTGAAVLSTWDDDPWVRAAYSTASVGTDADTPIGPIGPIHLAGEHTAGRFAALMEGAVRSGLRVAEDVLSSAARTGS